MKLDGLVIEPNGSSGIEIRCLLSQKYNLREFTLNERPQPIFISPWMQFEPSAMNNERLAMAWEIARRVQAHQQLVDENDKLRVRIADLHDTMDGVRDTLHKSYDVWKADRAKHNLPADFSDITEWPPECMGDYRAPRVQAEVVKQQQERIAQLLDVLGMVADAATERRGEDFNLTPEQWATFHAARNSATGGAA